MAAVSSAAVSLRYRLSLCTLCRPDRAEPSQTRLSTKTKAAMLWSTTRGYLSKNKKTKQQAHSGVCGIKTLRWRSPVSSTAAPQTCRRSPSPSRTQHSLPSKVKQINPHLLTYPQPFFSPPLCAKTTQTPTELPKTPRTRETRSWHVLRRCARVSFRGLYSREPCGRNTLVPRTQQPTPVTKARFSDV